MEYRQIGPLRVSVLTLGTWQFGDTFGTFNGGTPLSEADEAAIVRAAVDAGINAFDTAEGYGDGKSERALARVMPSPRCRFPHRDSPRVPHRRCAQPAWTAARWC